MEMLLKPSVRDVDRPQLRALCVALAEQVRDFDPDVVIGIATGGADVAEEVTVALGGARRLAIVKSQRPGTKLKEHHRVSAILKALPERVANLARWFEVEYREVAYYVKLRLHGSDRSQPQARIERPEVLVEAVEDALRVLVVDDTVDSGQTLSGVLAAVRAANPRAQVRSAVIASTWRRPPLRPDYVLQSRMLLRLPSSFDA